MVGSSPTMTVCKWPATGFAPITALRTGRVPLRCQIQRSAQSAPTIPWLGLNLHRAYRHRAPIVHPTQCAPLRPPRVLLNASTLHTFSAATSRMRSDDWIRPAASNSPSKSPVESTLTRSDRARTKPRLLTSLSSYNRIASISASRSISSLRTSSADCSPRPLERTF
jgi:hypothetical protein